MSCQNIYDAYYDIFGVDKNNPESDTRYRLYGNIGNTPGGHPILFGCPPLGFKLYSKNATIEMVLSKKEVEEGKIIVVDQGRDFFMLDIYQSDDPIAVARFMNKFKTVYFIRPITTEEKEEILNNKQTMPEDPVYSFGQFIHQEDKK